VLTVFLVAREESSDQLGAGLMRALLERPGGKVRFLGAWAEVSLPDAGNRPPRHRQGPRTAGAVTARHAGSGDVNWRLSTSCMDLMTLDGTTPSAHAADVVLATVGNRQRRFEIGT
jgi:hypothetical protein